MPSSDWVKYSFPEGRTYRDGTPFSVELELIEGGTRVGEGYIHTFENYIGALDNTGFRIVQIHEPRANQDTLRKYPQLNILSYPSSLVIQARKRD